MGVGRRSCTPVVSHEVRHLGKIFACCVCMCEGVCVFVCVCVHVCVRVHS